MFEDKRSKKILLVAHCILNQNAKIDRCAHYPGMMTEVTRILLDAGVGILQMPCPELLCLGLDRQVDRGVDSTVESEDTRVAHRMGESWEQALCHRMISELVYQIEEYRQNGFEVVGVVGCNGSPTCGVEFNWADGKEKPEPGVFIGMLSELCRGRGIPLPMRGVRAYEPVQAVEAVRSLLGQEVKEWRVHRNLKRLILNPKPTKAFQR